ncbi:MAG: hypothetical protein PHG18_05060, partial [Bacilli bacterium]|nr:hypothetical protein [Bacilli bacterium]
MEFIAENYIWFIVGGVVLLMALIGFIAEKTNFGRSEFEKKVREPKPKKEKGKKGKNKEVSEVTAEPEQGMPVDEAIVIDDEDWMEPIPTVTNDPIINMTDSSETAEDLNAPVIESPIVAEDLNAPLGDKPVVEDLNVPLGDTPVVEDLNVPLGDKPVVEDLNAPLGDAPVVEDLNTPIEEVKPVIAEESNTPIEEVSEVSTVEDLNIKEPILSPVVEEPVITELPNNNAEQT